MRLKQQAPKLSADFLSDGFSDFTHWGSCLMRRTLFSIRLLASLVLVGFTLLGLAACGGGGGGGGSSSGGGLRFSADKSALTFDVNPGIATPSQTVTITASGTYSGTIYVSATATGQGLAASIPITISGQTATAVVSADESLAAGTYTGKLNLMACSDAACKSQIGNSPLTLSFTVNVHTPLQLSPNSIAASATSGAGVSQAVTIQLPNGASSSSATVTSGNGFVTVNSATATGFTVTLASMPSGTYTGSITVTAGSSSAVLPITYTVSAPAGGDVPLTAAPSSLTLNTVENGTTSTTLTITPPSWNPLVAATAEYPAGGASGWLSTAVMAGGFQVNANATGLLAGSYTATVRVHGAYPSTDILVPVALTVGPRLVRPADSVVTVNAETTSAALAGGIPVNLAAGPPVNWTANSNVPWLAFSKGSGTTGQSLAYQIDGAQLVALANGAKYVATITLTPASATMTPVSFLLTLSKQLPEISSLAPYTQVTGQAARVVLRGTGFTGITNPSARLSIQGGTPASITVVNDTEMVATFNALSAGNHVVSVSNALGLTTSSRSVTAVLPVSHSYAATPTGANIRTLVYDAEREAVLASNSDANTIMRFTPSSSGAWTATSVASPSVGEIGLSIDGTRLIAMTSSSANPGTITALDPATLSVTQSVVQPRSIGPGFTQLGFGLSTTNDGRTWFDLETATPPFSDLAYTTLDALTANVVSIPTFSTLFYSGPWFAHSRDGERLLIVQSSSVSPTPPMLYLDAADGVVHQNPAGLTFSYRMSLNDKGDRAVFDATFLRDASFNLLGQLMLPAADNYYAIDALLSPDGSRIYALSYPNSGPSGTPRIYVFDATVEQASLPLIGYFTIPDFPSCQVTSGASVCTNYNFASTISIDGQTLYYAGQQYFVVVPTNTPLAIGMKAPATLKSLQRRAPTPWPLHLH